MKETLGIILMLSFNFPVLAADQVYMQKPTAPMYEVCNLVTVEGHTGPYQIQDTNCTNRNSVTKSEYEAKVRAYNNSGTIYNNATSTATKPVAPTYETCQQTDDGNGHFYSDYACQARNQAKQQEYNLQSQAWGVMQANTDQATQAKLAADQADAAARMKSQSATEALQKAIAENKRASQKSSSASKITAALSVAAGVAFAVSCIPAGNCNYYFLAASVGFGIMSALNGKQSNDNAMSGFKACETQNQISSSPVDCGPSVAGYDISSATPTGSALTSMFDSNGKCIATEKNTCNAVIAGLPAGTNIKDLVKGASSFASPFKINPDGSATTKDGKIVKPSDFKDAASLQAAGYSAEQAQAALAALAKGNAMGVPSSGLDAAAAELKKANSDFSGTAMAGSGSGSGSTEGKTGDLGSSGKLGSKDIGGGQSGAGKNRNPAGEGLTRDFNGEAIGSAGDDIFSMMNRRYKMKTTQDSFISN